MHINSCEWYMMYHPAEPIRQVLCFRFRPGGTNSAGELLRHDRFMVQCIYHQLIAYTGMHVLHTFVHMYGKYRMAGNFGGKIFWRIAKNMSFGEIYFGS